MTFTAIHNFAEMPVEGKKAYLSYLCTQEPEPDDQLKAQLKMLMRADEDDAVRAMAIQLAGASVDEKNLRDTLTNLMPQLPKGSMSRDILISLLITALSDEIGEVKTWGIGLLQAHENINPENNLELFDFISKNLDNETASLHLRWHCILGLAHVGTRQAIDKLLVFGKKLFLKLPLSSEGDVETSDKFLAEKTAYSLGLAVEKICAYGKTREALHLLERTAGRLTSDNSSAKTANWAISRIKNYRCEILASSCVMPTVESIRRFFSFRFSVKLAGVCAAACLVLVIVKYNTGINVNISMSGIRDKTSMRGNSTPAGEFEVNQGGVLKSGDSFRITFNADKDAYVRVLLYDSSKEITELFSDKVSAGKNIVISTAKDGAKLQLDNVVGTETIYVLASKIPIEDFDKKLDELKKSGIDKINHIFLNTSIQIFRFGHE